MSHKEPGLHLDAGSTVTALGETQLPAPVDGGVRAHATVGDHRYASLGPLGAGGMGVVERVWDGDLMRELAVKRIRRELGHDPRMTAQFLWEARVTAYLDHPNIVPVHDLGAGPDGEPYFVMKRAAGEPLDRILERLRADASARDAMPLPRRLRVLQQVAQAIAFAHRRGVLHRDLKPSNVMVGDDGEVLVMDWGLAVPLPGPAGDRLRAVMPSGLEALSAGTPLYMSPEQARGEPLDERSDVFTLGVMLYELASLARPFAGDSAREVTARVAAGRARPLRDAWPEAPSPLVAVIERALRAAPADRYPTVTALASDLERVLDGQTPRAEPISMMRRAARFYMSRDPAFAQLRIMDLDLMVASGSFIGVAACAAWNDLHGLWWMWAVLATIAGFPPTRRWLRLRRALAPPPR
ncbi:MAG TPA: serine/threonine-protein kinase [Kofleriaceae bacterium]|nr:serine/threonine-protein kinase [Kofleriaceae bacterium]